MDDLLKKSPYEDKVTSELIEGIILGDANAMIYLLVIKCGSLFKQLCNKYQQLGMTPEDLAQEVMISLYKNDYKALKDFKGVNKDGRSCKLTSYIGTIASNRMKALSREKNKNGLMKEPMVFRTLTIDEEILNLEDKGISEFTELETLEALSAGLSEDDRLILNEYIIEGKPQKDVAEKLEITVGALYTRASRLFQTLVERRIIE